MKDGFSVIDADRHVVEPANFGDLLEPSFKGRVELSGPGRSQRRVDGRPVTTVEMPAFSDPHYVDVFADAVADDFGPASNVRAMDREGVDVAVHYPTVGLYLIWRDAVEPALSAAICRAYNDWLAGYCGHKPDRLKGVALLPLQDPAAAAQELVRAVEQLDFVGAFLRPNPLDGRLIDDAVYDVIYEAAEGLGVPIAIHEGGITLLPQIGVDRTAAFGRHVVCHAFEQMAACLSFISTGLLDRFPNLRVAFLESGCGWLPYWLDRIDEHWEHFMYGKTTSGQRRPSEVFKAQCFISAEAGDELIDSVADRVSPDCLVVATDYPHHDAVDKFPDRTIGDLTGQPAIADTIKRKLLWDNPARLYGL